MKIFIASSTEHLDVAKDIHIILAEMGHTPMLWVDFFSPADFTFLRILEICNEADAGIFIIAPDDTLVDKTCITRDNVLIEAGAFYGKLGPEYVALCTLPNVNIPSDWYGITTINYSNENRYKVEKEIRQWISKIENLQQNTISKFLSSKLPDFEDIVSHTKSNLKISSFFISTAQTSPELNKAIQSGLNIKLLLADYWGKNLSAMATSLDGISTNGERVKAKLKSSLLNFYEMFQNGNLPSSLEIREIDYTFPTRMTIVDSDLDSGKMYVHITAYRNRFAPKATFHLTKSEPWFDIYNNEYDQLWSEATPLDFEKIKSLLGHE